jgi:TatD DNase family protein
LLVDTHCHLNFELFASDRAETLERARAAGVRGILNPGIDISSSQAALHLADQEPELFAAVGIHPNDASHWDEDSLPALRRLASHPKVVAIGEIGLDYYRDRTPRHQQEHAFQRQLELAAELNLPVIIHNRDATSDTLQILADWSVDLAGGPLSGRCGVLHSFSGSLQEAHQAIELGFYIGITGPVTFRKADELRQVAAGIPLDRLLIETDAPFLTPHPHRGQRNEPAYVRFVAEKIAEIHSLPFETAAQAAAANAERLFNWRVGI